MKIDLPEVVQEVSEAFSRYEDALVHNKVDVLDELFWDSPLTIRYGATENLYGYDGIKKFRAARPSAGLKRKLTRTVITTYGQEFAVVNTEFKRSNTEKIGRQSQTWIKFEGNWRVVAAHVSLCDG